MTDRADQAEFFVRAHGADLRKHLAHVFLGVGPDMGLAIAKRLVWEVTDMILESHGPTVAKDLFAELDAAIDLDIAPPLDLPADGPDPYVTALEDVRQALVAQGQAFADLGKILIDRVPEKAR